MTPIVFLFDRAEDKVFPMRMSEAMRRYSYTDAGLHDRFVVQGAKDHDEALAAAREWVRVRADDDEDLMPDCIALTEVEAGSGKVFMTLEIL